MLIKNNLIKFQLFLIVFIFLIGFAVRVAGISKIPSGFTNDEANVGYDAYSILKTGKDQWGQQQPNTYLKGFGDYRFPIHTYLVVPSVAVFGLNEFAVRLPSAIIGSLTVFLTFFLALLLWRNISIAFLSMIFLAFNPWHIAMSRVANESTFAIFFITLAVILFLLDLSKRKWLYLSMIFFALSVFTYTAALVFTPLLVAMLYLACRKRLLTDKKSAILALVIFVILSLLIVFGGKTMNVRSQQVNLTNDVGILNTVNAKRGECQVDFKNRLCQIFQNKFVAYTSLFVSNYLNHFSPQLLEKNGTPTQYSVLPERGLLYAIEYLLFIIGMFILATRRKEPEALLVLLWIFIAPVTDSLTGSGHYARFLPVLPTIQLASAVGAYEVWSLFAKKRWLIIPVIPILLYGIVAFFIVYWSYFPRFYAIYSHYGYKDLISYVQKNENNYDKIIFSNSINDTKQYIFYLFYTKYNPVLFQSGKDVEKTVEKNGWIRVKRVGKIYFLPSIRLSSNDLKLPLPRILLVGAEEEFPPVVKTKYKIKDPKSNTVFLLVDFNDNFSLLSNQVIDH